MRKTLLSILGLLCFMIMQAQVAKTVNMTQAGTLSYALTEDEKSTITDLTLTGPIDARDFKTMRDLMPLLAVLDMEGANIERWKEFYEYPANEIPENVFSDNKTLKTVNLPSGLTSIGSHAFYNCSGLTGELNLPSGLTLIGNQAFRYCSGLTSIRSYAQTPPVIIYETFKNTSIKIAFVPTGSKTAYQAANYWKDLAIIDEENAYTLHISTPGTLGAIILNAGERLNRVTSLVLTGELNSDDFLLIRDNMSLLHTLNMEGLSNKSIPDNAFKGNATLLKIVLPSGLTSIGNSAFEDCCGLTGELKLPSGLTSIGVQAFYNCRALTGELNLPSGLTSIGSYAFYNCSGLTGELNLPSGLTSIGSYTFYNCSGLTGELNLPAGITSIENNAFYGCSGFTGELNLPSGLTSIGSYAFYNCSGLTGELNLPSGLTAIGSSTFFNCSSLTSIHIKKNVKNIYKKAFSDCSNVSKITCEAVTPPRLESDVFSGINTETSELHIPQGSQMNYLLAPQWGAFANIIEMDMPAESYLTSFVVTPGGKVQSNGTAVSNGSKIEIKAGESMKLAFAPQAGYALDQVLFDGENMTAQVQNNQWTSPAVSKAVTVSVSFKTVQYEVAILTVGSGAMNAHIVEHNSTHTYRLAATEGYLIENVTLNGTDVTPDLENGKLTLHDIAEDQTLVITSKRDGETSEIEVSSDKTIRTWKANGQLFVESTEEMSAAEVVDMSGRTACSISKTAYAYVLNLPSNGVYVVRIRTVNGEVKTVKVAM